MRSAVFERETRETKISVELNIDGSGEANVSTGVGFFDHMLISLAKHSDFDIKITAVGDTDVDCHHTVEDVGICIGKAFSMVLGEKGGIARYGSFYAPMDEALAMCALDISGRPFLVFNGQFNSAIIGKYDTQMTKEFFNAFAFNASVTLHLSVLYGENDHHKTEAAFKAFAHALKIASRKTGAGVLSAKGVL